MAVIFPDVYLPFAVALDIEFAELPIEFASLTPYLRIFWLPRLGVCPCAFANDRAKCLRSLRMFRLPRQPRARARRRQRHGGSGCERGPPGGDGDDGGGAEPPGPRSGARRGFEGGRASP
jgi:hypothetical protein